MSFQKLGGSAQERDRHSSIAISGWVSHPFAPVTSAPPVSHSLPKPFALLAPLRRKLDSIQVHNPKFAHFLADHIPAQCPFERDVKLFGRTLLHIPPMCKLNPLYEEVIALRFRALCYLADECGEDISQYC
ncbi:Mo-dependent nitrogenase C-terminal domain-containing protein [Leptolyngbya sp. DQ-M1]|uniref:Mo-dependent nitrogenase C-terminal domain-containing protein n=1 Tax=Leptolyngbya sp. DQ-M1 TaxID=2933920 RepID=UPI0032986099